MKKYTGPTIWGGPRLHTQFHEHDYVFADNYKRHGTIVSGELTPGVYGIQPAVLVEFQSGEGLPGNDRVQTVPLSQLHRPETPTEIEEFEEE